MSEQSNDSTNPYADGARREIKEQSSQWKLYSIGIAANNKVVDSELLYVVPIEAVSMQDGELISQPFTQDAEGWDGDDKLYRVQVKTDTAIQCRWKRETNRRTPPDVRRGERVEIYRFADRDIFYWASMGLDEHLRKLETMVIGISGTPKEEEDGTLPDHGYHIELSTHKGSITIQTSAKNGEKCTYAIQIDAMGGKVTISDELGNNFHINSNEAIVEMENADKTIVQLNKQDIFMKAANNIAAEAGNNITFNAGNAIELKAGANIVLSPGGKVLVNGKSQFMDTVQMDAKLTATGIESAEPIIGPTDTI